MKADYHPSRPKVNANRDGSFRLLERLWKEAWVISLPAMQFKALGLMCAFSGADGVASISYGTISRLTGMNQRNARKAVKALRDAGILEQVSSGGGHSKASRYRINLPDGPEVLPGPRSYRDHGSTLGTSEKSGPWSHRDHVPHMKLVLPGPPSREDIDTPPASAAFGQVNGNRHSVAQRRVVAR